MVENQSPGELNFREFVDAYIRRIEQLPGYGKVMFDESHASIRYEYQGRGYFVRPNNAYADYRKDINRLDAVVDGYIKAIQSSKDEKPLSFREAAPSLMPMVRDRRYLDLTALIVKTSGQQGAPEAISFPFRVLAGELVVTLARDSADAVSLAGHADLNTWGVTFDEACEVALKNLRARSEDRMDEVAPGFYVSRWHDIYDATRLLLTDLLSRLKLRGDPVVAVPSRNHLLVAGSKDPVALSLLVQATAQVLSGDPRPLSGDILQFSGGRWIEAESSLQQDVALVNARNTLLHRDYGQQKELLEKLHKADGSDLFVATYRLAKDAAGGKPLFNVAQLTEGVVTLLPKADHVLLMTRSKEMLAVTWADAEAALGGALKKLRMHPPRYLADTFPNDAQLSALRAKVVMVLQREDIKQTSKPHQVLTQPPNPETELALVRLRDKFSSIQKKPTARTFEFMRAPIPGWMKDPEPLAEIGKQQLLLLAQGRIVWASLVMANNLMFSPGTADCPGILVYSSDPYFDSRPHELRAIAHKMFELKNTTPDDPELREVARVVTDEMNRSMGWKLPEAITNRDVRAATFMVFRQHIPGGVLRGGQFPVLIHPSTQAVMIVPFEAWPTELIHAWQQEQRR